MLLDKEYLPAFAETGLLGCGALTSRFRLFEAISKMTFCYDRLRIPRASLSAEKVLDVALLRLRAFSACRLILGVLAGSHDEIIFEIASGTPTHREVRQPPSLFF